MKLPAVTTSASIGKPAPQAIPIAAVIQTLAAVVNPRTMSPRTKIRPPPIKPMPVTICAATRDRSSSTRLGERTSLNPNLETSIINAAPNPTSVYVRRPALFWRISRSNPISPERTNARANSPTCSQPCPTSSPILYYFAGQTHP